MKNGPLQNTKLQIFIIMQRGDGVVQCSILTHKHKMKGHVEGWVYLKKKKMEHCRTLSHMLILI